MINYDNRILPSSISNLSRIVKSILIILSGFFAPWGSGTQHVTNFDLSKIFVAVAVLLIFYWLIFTRHKFRVFPKYFNYFILFVALHTFITYVLIYPEDLRFGYTGVSYLQADFIQLQEAKGMVIARFFLFALFGYALASLLKTEKQLIALSLAYGAGLAAAIALGGYSAVSGSALEIRFSGGFLNPNAFGFTAVICFFLNATVISVKGLKSRIKILSITFMGCGLGSMLLSGSRGAILGLFVGLILLLIYSPTLKRKIRLTVGFLAFFIVLYSLLPSIVVQTLESRISVERIREDRGAKRLDIWTDYLRGVRHYMLLGSGMGRSMEAIRDSYIFRLGAPHNNYLATWVQFGSIGLVLYLTALYQLWKKISGHALKRKRTTLDAVFLSFFFAILVMLLFGDYYGCRDLWIFFGIMAAYSSWNTKLEHLRSVKSLREKGSIKCVESPA